jgi:hypothetical protein
MIHMHYKHTGLHFELAELFIMLGHCAKWFSDIFLCQQTLLKCWSWLMVHRSNYIAFILTNVKFWKLKKLFYYFSSYASHLPTHPNLQLSKVLYEKQMWLKFLSFFAFVAGSSTTSLKKPRNRGIFSSFFCCFGNNNNNNNNNPPANCTVPPVEENGNPRVRAIWITRFKKKIRRN